MIATFRSALSTGSLAALALLAVSMAVPAAAHEESAQSGPLASSDPALPPPDTPLDSPVETPLNPQAPPDETDDAASKFRPVEGAFTQFLSSAVSGSPDSGLKYGGRVDLYITIPRRHYRRRQ